MTKPREQLIADLAADLTPVHAPGQTGWLTVGWLVGAAVFAVVVLLATGSFRPSGGAQLAGSPQLLVESLFGLAAIAGLARAAMRLAIPSIRGPWMRVATALLLLAIWIGFYVYGLYDPAIEPAMAGKREGCWIETTLLGVPALLAGLFAVRRLWPLHGALNGLLLGLAAGAVPALLMQFACMYIPQHILLYHILPGLLLGPIGAIAGLLLLHRR